MNKRAQSASPPEQPGLMEWLYATMYRIRRFEEETTEQFLAGAVKGTAHSYIGEEAIAAGACANLREDDYIGSTHRGHGHCIAKGADLRLMMAELMGKETGYCRGLGGSMHIADLKLNILGANGIVGGSMPLGTGAALAAKIRGTDQVVISFFGDGAANQGIFHESLNLASIWKLPVIFICENNQWALNTSYLKTTSVERISMRSAAYGIPGVTVDGNDALEVNRVVNEAVTRARRGEGPTLIEAMTWRWGQHSMRANLPEPRSMEDVEAWMDRDPLKHMEKLLGGGKKAAPQASRASSSGWTPSWRRRSALAWKVRSQARNCCARRSMRPIFPMRRPRTPGSGRSTSPRPLTRPCTRRWRRTARYS
ncbi:MAG: thiamine pyrophosphate-dependent dehydrogenase E1 component subunit alpha [SAR324 cluster bacterium]|nr:thiamine pyrophosphate-dependent dehydrogenase E1 component subunit alpha [SAR324 cluster bacterium]